MLLLSVGFRLKHGLFMGLKHDWFPRAPSNPMGVGGSCRLLNYSWIGSYWLHASPYHEQLLTFILFERVSFQVLTLLWYFLFQWEQPPFLWLYIFRTVYVWECRRGSQSCSPAFQSSPLFPKAAWSLKELGHSTISSWAMGSTCLLMQRGSELVRAVAEQGREGMRHVNSSS